MAAIDGAQDRLAVPESAQGGAAHDRQYGLAHILGLWAVAALPMALLAWVITPALIPRIKLPPALVFWLMMIVGLAWQFAVSLWVIHREEGDLRWSTIRRRIWLNVPLNPRTDRPQLRLFWRLLPFLLVAFISMSLGMLLPTISWIVPYVLNLRAYARFLLWLSYVHVTEFASPEFAGQWWLVVVTAIGWVLGALLAEELLFRGILLSRMAGVFGKWDWAANAALYALYHLFRPWMIPFRLIDALVIAWPARRFRSNWMAVGVRGVEGLVLLAIVLLGVMSPTLTTSPATFAFPHIGRQPDPLILSKGVITAIPAYDPASGVPYQVDLRGTDLSALDLRTAANDLAYADFDSRTIWPSSDRLPDDFDPGQTLELGKNPGLGIRTLHAQGITGRGVGVAIIDQPLLVEHQEYADRLRWYEEIGGGFVTNATIHGPAVASIAVGKTVGVAPGADLYYIGGAGSELKSLFLYSHDFAQGIRRLLQINERLPQDRKIRVISISTGWLPWMSGYYDVIAAVQEAEAAGILVINVDTGTGLANGVWGMGRQPMADPDVFESYEPGIFLTSQFFADHSRFEQVKQVWVPMDTRTVASPSGKNEYAFNRVGGGSWVPPYIAGLYALAGQVDPTITPDRFWSLALETGRTIDVEHEGQKFKLGPIIDPVTLINALQARP